MSEQARVLDVRRQTGVAGQFSYKAQVQYPDEPRQTVEFVGSVYGGPIVMVMPGGQQVFVNQRVTDRIGSKLSPEWIRRFFGPRDTYY